MAVVANAMAPDRVPVPRELQYWLKKPVQNLPPGHFDSDKVEWFSEEALLPIDRLEDFLAGEGGRTDTACTYTKQKTYDVAMVSGKCTTYFWCSYGPEDYRVPSIEQIPEPRGKNGKGPGSRPLGAYRALGLSQKRGCRSHFQVYFFKARTDVALVKWRYRPHTDKDGKVCHGLHDESSVSGNAIVAPRLSKKCRDYVERLLRTGVEAAEILKFHVKHIRTTYEEVTDEQTFWPRDLQLTMKDITNIRTKLRKVLHNYHSDDAVATKMWVQKNLESVIFYQSGNEEDAVPFILVFGTEWMLTNLAKYGHDSAIALDATFGSNSYGFYFFTVLCYDQFQNGLPSCWALLGRHEAKDIEVLLSHVRAWATMLRQEKLKLEGEWTPSCVIVDDSCEEQLAIRNVFPGVRILLCFWHVRRCWLKHLVGRVRDPILKAEMHRALGRIMYTTGGDAVALSIEFMDKYKEQVSFVQYYKQNWHGRIDKWSKDYRKFRHNNQETNGAVERWHRTFKTHLRAERKWKSGRRVSWLLHVLMDEIESLYWTVSQLKLQGRVCNRIVQRYALKAIRNAREIPDHNVSLEVIEGRSCGFVKSQSNPEKIHEVVSFDTDLATCTCPEAMQGNVCKHQIKCLMLKGYSEVDLLRRLGSAFGSLAGGFASSTNTANGEDSEMIDLNSTTVEENDPSLDELLQESCERPSGSDGVNDSYEPIPVSNPAGTSKILSKADAHMVIESMWQMLSSDDEELAAHASVLITDAAESLKKLIATRDSIKAVVVEPFVPVGGTDCSLRRKPDFLETMFSHGRKRTADTSVQVTCRSEVVVPHFTRKVQARRSMQQELDNRALLSLDLNSIPVNYLPETPTITSSRKRK